VFEEEQLMKRRHFLEFAGGCLATLGWSGLDLLQQGDRYGRVLAQSTPRKLALLVGINQYPESSFFTPLYGCVTDVHLQQELLVNRFGFNPKDIYTLTDQQATRQGILQAFQEHLVQQAKPGDVVVFHYSGHGSRVADPDRDNSDGLNSTFVPVDSRLPAGYPDQGGTVLDITGHSLFLLTRAIQSDSFTAVLDSCHSGGGTRGNLRIRSRDGNGQLQASPQEQELQEKLLAQVGITPAEFIQQRRLGVGNGVIIAGARRDQLAADASFSDVDCGVFTYLLTQYLWQQTQSDPIKSLLPSVTRNTTRLSTTQQEPAYEVKPNSQNDRQPLYFMQQTVPPADAVITQVQGSQINLWLGGIDPQSLAAFNQGTLFRVIDAQNRPMGELQLESRKGLVAQAKLTQSGGALRPGLFLQEQVRGLPSDVKLTVGLDPSLGQETSAAQQDLNALPRVQAVPLLKGEVQYILGRFTEVSRKQALGSKSGGALPPIGSLGLFSAGGDLIPASFGPANEAISAAIVRLKPKLKALLAARIFKLALNTDSSRLNVVVAMRPEGQTAGLVAEVFPTRGVGKSSGLAVSSAGKADPNRLPLGTPVQFEVSNQESQPLYVSVLVIDPTGEMTVVFPNNWTASAEATRVSPSKTIRIPDPELDSFKLITQEPKGMVEVLIIASRTPIRQALKGLQAIANQSGQTRGPVALADPVEVMEGLLSDLSAASEGTRSPSRTRGLAAVARPIDTAQIATMSMTFEVI
jgi:hypothetical protein